MKVTIVFKRHDAYHLSLEDIQDEKGITMRTVGPVDWSPLGLNWVDDSAGNVSLSFDTVEPDTVRIPTSHDEARLMIKLADMYLKGNAE